MHISRVGGAKTLLATAMAGAIAGAAGPAAADVPASGDPVLYWSQVLASGLTGSPTVTSRSYAMVAAGIHDAVNATTGQPDFSYIPGVATAGGDTRAATAVAARNLLVAVNPSKTAVYDAALASSLALVPDGAAKTNGIATGSAIASAMLTLRANDGTSALSSYAPSGGIGDWAPTPPGNLPAAVPQWADSQPWVLASNDQFRPAAPPALGSAAYAVAYNEVMEIGSATSLTRTADQSAAADFWVSAAGTAPWLQAGLSVAETAGLSTIENARLFALISVSVADAVVGIWDAKYEYDLWRPVTAIRSGDLDGNAATVGDPTWTPYEITPNHPSYISGHSGVASAAATVLASYFGDAQSFCLTSGGLNRCWTSYSGAAQDAANSRLWGGIHWRYDNEAGLALGQQVAQYVLSSSAFDAVPEPSSWTMMIVGVGAAGAILRRRRRLALGLS